MFSFKHAPEEVHALIQGLELKIKSLQDLLNRIVAEANTQAQQQAPVQQPVEQVEEVNQDTN
jgi:hypothetical protein